MIFLKKIIILLLVILSYTPALSVKYNPLKRKDLRYYSMGGAYTALTGHKLMAYYNPAAFAFNYKKKRHYRAELYEDFKEVVVREKQRYFSPFSLDMKFGSDYFQDDVLAYIAGGNMRAFIASYDKNKLLSFLGFHQEYSNIKTNTTEGIIELLDENIYLKSAVNMELLHYSTKNWAAAMDLLVDIEVKALNSYGLPPLNLPRISIVVDNINYFALGFELPRPHNMALGITAKVFERVAIEADDANKAAALFDFYTNKHYTNTADSLVSAVNRNFFKFITGQEKVEIYGNFLHAGTGFGFDIGWMYRPRSRFYLGAMLNNAPAAIKWINGSFKFFPATMDIGCSYQFNFNLLGIFKKPLVAVGLSDIFDIYDHRFFKKVNFGLEFATLFDFMKIRLGLHHGFTCYSVSKDINLYELRKVPFIKLFFPQKLFKPLSFFQLIANKRFNYEGFLDYYRRNIIMWLGSLTMRGLSVLNYHIEAGIYGEEISEYLGTMKNYNFMFNISADMVF